MGQNKENNNRKLDKKDLIIIIISSFSLILLLLIIVISRNHDRALSETLQKNRDVTADDLIADKNSEADEFLEITEVSGEKWVEIHNIGTETIDLSGLEILVSGNSVGKVEDDVKLKKDAYAVIDTNINPGNRNSNLLSLKNKNGKQIKSLLIPKLSDEQSYGIVDEETNKWGYFSPSKGKKNSSKNLQLVQYDGISFSAPGGFYNDSFALQLAADDGETIYYTTDGTRPTLESEIYDTEIKISNKSGTNYVYAKEAVYNRLSGWYAPRTIDAGMIVRAIAVDSSGKVTKEASQSYFIGLIRDTDYQNMPVLSITTDPENLFSYEDGIYVAGKAREDALIQGLNKISSNANYLSGLKKNSKIEYFEPNKSKSFEFNVEMSVLGDDSCIDKQKGLEFDLNDADYSDFNGSGIIDFISSFGKIKLQQNYDDNLLKVRNHIVSSFAEDLNVSTMDCQPCILFIDGEYWGLYSLNAYYDEKYIKRHYGISGKEIDFHNVEGYEDHFGEFYSFVTNNDLSISENYETVKSMLDIDSYIDYVCLNVYLGNSEFFSHQGTAWRVVDNTGSENTFGKWRFMCGDMSHTMYLSSKQTPTINTFLQLGIKADLLLQSLLMNEEFCDQFKSRMNKLISDTFIEEKYEESIEKIVKLIKKPALASFNRFYGGPSEKQYTALVDNIIAFLEERPVYMAKYTEEFVSNGGDIQYAKELLEELEAKKKTSDSEENQEGEDGDIDGESNLDQNIEGEETINEDAEATEGESMTIEEDNSNGVDMQQYMEAIDSSIISEQNEETTQEEDVTND
ncbi:CotH kinase family protein [Butyrivibrio sp. LC3010]|uniref:CotH kinase family protein n=1 Tax=Butyrivibrio sp. LC3010 TaxID=1280680 RepID=UPI00042A7A81|nr:CotH kinase family protein [Butyrivibrio sp. LC3010]